MPYKGEAFKGQVESLAPSFSSLSIHGLPSRLSSLGGHLPIVCNWWPFGRSSCLACTGLHKVFTRSHLPLLAKIITRGALACDAGHMHLATQDGTLSTFLTILCLYHHDLVKAQ
ncbi:hypothetical protein CCHL11_03997 [Colletotrichum chlorophyti]|uniref:Uncharacterized protein n=1 Tax=Colletotrichum chlorophyti TaxID=708187 RepID=A0A1Q8RL60_9PEZI|nr:hypothetical protein CCHL11_03997 [Colletotrichum chlorophyti]